MPKIEDNKSFNRCFLVEECNWLTGETFREKFRLNFHLPVNYGLLQGKELYAIERCNLIHTNIISCYKSSSHVLK